MQEECSFLHKSVFSVICFSHDVGFFFHINRIFKKGVFFPQNAELCEF